MTALQTLYIDMDNVLVDFPSGINRLSQADTETYEGHYDEAPGIFALMDPIPGATDAFRLLSQHFDTFILSTAPWRNPSAWSDKLAWVHSHLGDEPESPAYKRLILSHHKHLNRGDILIDDRTHNGADRFEGELVLFGSEQWPTWTEVVDYLMSKT